MSIPKITFNLFADILNYEKPTKSNQYFNDQEEGITCFCLPECHHIDYAKEIAAIAIQ